MVDQDPCSGSVARDIGHRMMAVTQRINLLTATKSSFGLWVELMKLSQLSDVEFKENDPLFKFNDENVTILQTPDAALTPVQTYQNIIKYHQHMHYITFSICMAQASSMMSFRQLYKTVYMPRFWVS